MKGWQVCGLETLEMERVTDARSSLYGTIPAPRVVQNQLDRNLEEYVARVEIALVKQLQNAMLRTKSTEWITVFTTVAITLHVVERDIWRLEYWVLNPGVVSKLVCKIRFAAYDVKSYKWRHPEPAATLIGRSVQQSNLILNHLRLCGDVPRQFCGIEENTKLQQLDEAKLRYNWKEEGSIDFALCCLAFEPPEGRLVKLARTQEFGC